MLKLRNTLSLALGFLGEDRGFLPKVMIFGFCLSFVIAWRVSGLKGTTICPRRLGVIVMGGERLLLVEDISVPCKISVDTKRPFQDQSILSILI